MITSWETALAECVRQAQAPRWQRILRQPIQHVVPRVALFTGNVIEREARTFWGASLHVLLPERVSTRVWRYGFFEEDVCRFLLRILQAGDTFVDVGAHYGFFTRLGAALVGAQGRVVAFEPTPHTFSQLQKNTAHLSQITALPLAAYSRASELTLCDFGIEYAAYNSAYGLRESDARALSRVAPTPFVVQARTLDDVLSERQITNVRLVKIDAESAELHVLQGMQKTLKTMRPAIILEVGDFDLAGVPRTRELCEWLAAYDYVPQAWHEGALIQPQKLLSVAPANWLFQPRENI